MSAGDDRVARDGEDNEFVRAFKEPCKFTSGYGVSYGANALNWSAGHPAKSPLMQSKGTRLVPGSLFINADVMRVVDANVVHLEQEVPLDGSFRIFVFAGDPCVTRTALRDHFFTLCVILACKRARIEIPRDIPGLLARHREHVYADDAWDSRAPRAKAAAHAKMGLDEARGGVVVVRPDGYVGMVASLVEGGGTIDALDYFSTFCTKKLGGPLSQL